MQLDLPSRTTKVQTIDSFLLKPAKNQLPSRQSPSSFVSNAKVSAVQSLSAEEIRAKVDDFNKNRKIKIDASAAGSWVTLVVFNSAKLLFLGK